MIIKKQYNRFNMFSLLFCCFFILTGFEFEAVQKELVSAESLINEKNYTEAEELLKSILDDLKEPDESNTELEVKMANGMFIPQIYLRLGEMQYNNNNYETAKTYFKEILNCETHSMWNIKAIHNLGMSDFNLRKYSDARNNFSKLVSEYKDSSEAAEGQYYIGVCYELEDNAEKSKASFEKFLDLYPDHPWAGKVEGKLSVK